MALHSLFSWMSGQQIRGPDCYPNALPMTLTSVSARVKMVAKQATMRHCQPPRAHFVTLRSFR